MKIVLVYFIFYILYLIGVLFLSMWIMHLAREQNKDPIYALAGENPLKTLLAIALLGLVPIVSIFMLLELAKEVKIHKKRGRLLIRYGCMGGRVPNR